MAVLPRLMGASGRRGCGGFADGRRHFPGEGRQSGGTLRRVLVQQTRQNLAPDGIERREKAEGVRVGFIPKPREQAEDRHAEGERVGRGARALPPQDFGGQVAARPHHELPGRGRIRRDEGAFRINRLPQTVVLELRDAEIAQYDPALAVEKQVVEFDVAVDDAEIVDVVEGRGDLGEPAGDFPFARLARRKVGQRPGLAAFAAHEIHDEIGEIALRENVEVEDVRDVRMVEPREDLALGEEAPAEVLDVPVVEGEGLHRRTHAQPAVFDFVHRPHAAASEDADDAVGPNDVIFTELHGPYYSKYRRSELP